MSLISFSLLLGFPLLLIVLSVGICAADLSLFQAYRKTCGKSRLTGGTIIGGSLAGDGEFPWLGSLQLERRDKSIKHFCAAAIISDRYLLTAGHCFQR